MGNKQLNKYHVICLIMLFLTPAHSLLVYFIQPTGSAQRMGNCESKFKNTLTSELLGDSGESCTKKKKNAPLLVSSYKCTAAKTVYSENSRPPLGRILAVHLGECTFSFGPPASEMKCQHWLNGKRELRLTWDHAENSPQYLHKNSAFSIFLF